MSRVFYKPLPIGRCDVGHGSSISQPGPAPVGRASGKSGAFRFLKLLYFFRRKGAVQYNMLKI
jgi:hypothetical protein